MIDDYYVQLVIQLIKHKHTLKDLIEHVKDSLMNIISLFYSQIR